MVRSVQRIEKSHEFQVLVNWEEILAQILWTLQILKDPRHQQHIVFRVHFRSLVRFFHGATALSVVVDDYFINTEDASSSPYLSCIVKYQMLIRLNCSGYKCKA